MLKILFGLFLFFFLWFLGDSWVMAAAATCFVLLCGGMLKRFAKALWSVRNL